MAVELSSGSYGHLAIPNPIPGTYSDLGKCVKFDCNRRWEKIHSAYLFFYVVQINTMQMIKLDAVMHAILFTIYLCRGVDAKKLI